MTYYEQTLADASRKLSASRARNRTFIVSEILTFILALTGLIAYTTEIGRGWMLVAAAVMLALYLYIRYIDVRNDRVISTLEDVCSVCEKELRYLKGDFHDFADGEKFTDSKHPFCFDLDIFGRGSLFQRMNRTVTSGGAKALATNLRLDDGPHDERHEAIKTLSENPQLLTDFKRYGQRGTVDTDAVAKAYDKMRQLPMPWWTGNKAVNILTKVYCVVFLLAIAFCIVTQTHLLDIAWWCVINFFAVYLICRKSMDKVTDAVNRLGKQVDTYVNLVRIVETVSGNDDVLTSLRRRVEGAGESMRTLDDMLHKLDSRGNILGLFFFDMLFLWDYRILHTFSTWQRAYSDKFGEWIDAVSEFDMLVSMATFRYNESGLTTDAEVIDSPKVVFEAQGLFHPFLGRKAVSNDFNIADRNFYIITGANMAGKSTFLRSLGVNYVLAMNGMPVFAKKLRTSRFRLFTSMRTTDDLTYGISYFNAELLRLQQILDLLKTDEPKDGWSGLLVILDEILKGTNSEDKLTGSKMFLEYVAQKNVTGVIATHDLKLSAMEDEQPERFHNYCFEIALGTNVTYSYKISKGVARNQNATFLLRKMLEG